MVISEQYKISLLKRVQLTAFLQIYVYVSALFSVNLHQYLDKDLNAEIKKKCKNRDREVRGCRITRVISIPFVA